MLAPETWEFLYGALRNGLGLAAACEGLHLDIKAMSTFLARSPDTLAKMVRQQATGFTAHLDMMNAAQNKRNAGTWAKARDNTTRFIKVVTMWEGYCARASASPEAIASAFSIYRDVLEVATATGFTRAEFYTHLQENPSLRLYLLQAGHIAP